MSMSGASSCSEASSEPDSAHGDAEALACALERCVGSPIRLRMNRNRSTMISVRKGPGELCVSLHQMFLGSPPPVMEALCHYLKGQDQRPSRVLRAYIDQSLSDQERRRPSRPRELQPKGEHYDLTEIYRVINQEYFCGALDLQITWYGCPKRKVRRRITFGQYVDVLKLVKIHRRLDRCDVPRYFVDFVVYHEMLHHVLPSYVDSRGKRQIHHPEFCRRERDFKYYEQANKWMRDAQQRLFT